LRSAVSIAARYSTNLRVSAGSCVPDPADLAERISDIRLPFIIVVLVAFSASAASAVEPRLAPVRFAPAPGWHVRHGTVHACVGVSAARCSQVTSSAATTRWRDCLECLPHRTLAAMPADGIAIQVSVAIEHPARVKPAFAWPPQIRRGDVNAGFEGLPGRIGVYQGSTRVDEREVFVFVFFGRGKPTARQLDRANTELRHARLD
jgi:hypothetical protein